MGMTDQDLAPTDPERRHAATGRAPGPELRKHLRVQIDDTSTSFSIKGISTTLGSGRVSRGRAAINLSEGGAMLLVREPLPVGTPVVVRIEVADRQEYFEANGQVRWCGEEGTGGGEFQAGIEFVGLAPGELRKIDRMREWFGSSPNGQRPSPSRATNPSDTGSPEPESRR